MVENGADVTLPETHSINEPEISNLETDKVRSLSI